MKKSNYDRMRDQMELAFLNYNQETMAARYGLVEDSLYLYLDFIGRAYRINRRSGRVE